MMSAEHRRPFAAFLLVFGFACVVMANGLRDQVVQVFVDSGAPRPLISAVVPDIVLGHSLRDAPVEAPVRAPVRAPAQATAESLTPTQSRPIESRPVTSAARAPRTVAATVVKPRHAKHHKSQVQAAPVAPAHITPVHPPKAPSVPAGPS